MAFAVPALAHPEEHSTPGAAEQWNNGGASYADFNQEYQHIWDAIQHSLSDGSYSRPQAQEYMRAMQDIRARADAMQREGRYDPRDTQARLERLHETMHQAHSEGHAAQDRGQSGDTWNNGGDTYAAFEQEYQHIWQTIQHGVSDGAYTRRQAQGYYRAMQQIRARANAMERQGRYDPEDTQARLERLHETMHAAHERGHELQDRYGDNNYRR
jgi:serine phosphatase RsbU (regulator of sigma subunit)